MFNSAYPEHTLSGSYMQAMLQSHLLVAPQQKIHLDPPILLKMCFAKLLSSSGWLNISEWSNFFYRIFDRH